MDQPAQQDLFEVKLSPSGKLYIRKFEAAARILIIIGSVIALIFIAETIIRAVKIDPEIYAGNRLLLFHHRILPVYTAVYVVLLFLQLYYYWKVSSSLSKGIDYMDEATFNGSFTSLYRNAVFGIITLSLALVMNLFDLYLVIKYYIS